MSKRTNIDKEIEEILHNKIDHQLDDWSEAVPALKQQLLTYIKELVGREQHQRLCNYPEYECNCELEPANQLRQELLRKAEGDLG